MKIRVESFATYRTYTEHLPPDKRLDVPEGAVIRDVLDTLGVPMDKPIILIVNGRDRPAHTPLKEGDHLVFFPPLEGG